MKPHLPPHTFRPGEALILGEALVRVFCSRADGYDVFILSPELSNAGDPCDTRSLTAEDPFLTDWKIFEVSGKMSRETPGELERRNAMVEEERFKLTTPTTRATLEKRFGRDLDTILKNQPPPSKHFSAPPLLATPYIPVLPPEHRPNLHINA